MARRGVELIVGGRRDPQFGPLVLVGLGGILAEVLDDVVLALAPLHPDAALEMLGGLAARPGARRAPEAGEASIAARSPRSSSPSATRWCATPAGSRSTSTRSSPGRPTRSAVDALIVADAIDPAWDYEDPGGAADA